MAATYPHWRNHPEDWIVVDNAHPEIISNETWLAASKLSDHTKNRKSNQHLLRSTYLLTGLIRCSDCGFSFQGSSVRSKNHEYSRYIDSGWENKRVCSYYAIPKDRLEQFAINAVKETLSEGRTRNRIQYFLDLMMAEQPLRIQATIEHAEKLLQENTIRQRNIMEAIELCSAEASLPVLLQRLEALRKERVGLEEALRAGQDSEARETDLRKRADLVSEFVSNFERFFDAAPPYEKKLQLRRCIAGITVDRDRKQIQFALWRVPTLAPDRIPLLNKKAPTTSLRMIYEPASSFVN